MLSNCRNEIIYHIASADFIVGKRTAITIQGIVIAAAWNPAGEITAVDIAGYDEKRYRIADDFKGTQLRMLNKKRVVADRFLETEITNLYFMSTILKSTPPRP